MRLYDKEGKRADILLKYWKGYGYGVDISEDFFDAGCLEYDPNHFAYVVDSVDHCIAEAHDWEAGEGDYGYDCIFDSDFEERKVFVEEW